MKQNEARNRLSEIYPWFTEGAEGLVNLAELLSLLRLRSQRIWREGVHDR